MQERHNAIRDALAETLGMLAHKARTGQMTDDDVAVIYRAIHDAGGIRATVREIYDSVKAEIKPYNACDFYVTMNMVASDNWALLERWFPGMSAEDRNRRTVELAVNWLNDPDSQHAENKIWQYLHK